MFVSSRLNLARWFTLSMGSILVVFASVLYTREARDRLHVFDQALYSTGQVVASGAEEIVYGDIRQIDLENAPLLGSDSLRLDTDILWARWYTPNKQLLQFMGDIPPHTLDQDLGFQTLTVSEAEQLDRLRQLTVPVYREGRLLGYLQLAASLDPVEHPLQELRLFLVLGVPITLIVIAGAGWILGGMAMQPIRLSYQRLQQFTADASHELRTPLAAIVSNAQVALMEPVSLEEQTACLKIISEVSESMGDLVERLLFLARYQGDVPSQVFQTLDICHLLASIGADYASQASGLGVQFEADLPSAPCYLQAEPDLLRQAIVNLLDNAFRYTSAGGTIRLSCRGQGSWLSIQVHDSGIGIAAEDLPHIFERFYRVNKVRSRHSGGYGLGLAIVRQIIDLHHGYVTVSSIPMKGTQFEIRLPLNQAMAS